MNVKLKAKVKASDSYIVRLTGRNLTSRALQSSKWQLIGKSQWCCSANAAIHSTHERTIEPATAPPPQSTTPGLHPISIHQMAPPKRTSDCRLLLNYRTGKDERLSWPSWLTCSGRFTRITGHSSDAGRAQDRESSPAKDRRSTTVSGI